MTQPKGDKKISFYCQRPTDYKSSLKCDWQCGLCALFEGKRDVKQEL